VHTTIFTNKSPFSKILQSSESLKQKPKNQIYKEQKNAIKTDPAKPKKLTHRTHYSAIQGESRKIKGGSSCLQMFTKDGIQMFTRKNCNNSNLIKKMGNPLFVRGIQMFTN